jgi:ferredoxin
VSAPPDRAPAHGGDVPGHQVASTRVLDPAALQALLDALCVRGYRVLGPTVADGAVVLREVESLDDLPRGVGDDQDAGHYRLRGRDDGLYFGWAAPATSPATVLFPARELMSRIRRTQTPDGAGVDVEPAVPDGPVALFGVRSCDLSALSVLDAVLVRRQYRDVRYEARREDAFVVAVTCSHPAGTCFCASTGTGPVPHRTGAPFDISLTEVLDGEGHRFVAVAGSEHGAQVLDAVAAPEARGGDERAADAVGDRATGSMGRTMDIDGLRDVLYAAAESPRWQQVASRCLSCTNCTLVCPTCFCTAVEDVSDLTGAVTDRVRVWDSCFASGHSYLHGGSVRGSVAARYRQWATHKLAGWVDQFGMSGCVGCGRCITWCPAAIDLTEEVAAIRADHDAR